VALDIATGAKLWSYPSAFSQYFYASPAVDSSGVYAVDEYGGVYAFGLAASGASAAGSARRIDAASAGTLRMPYGSIFRTTTGGAVRARY
jgi:outer membrane protein assembly factor BamB